MNEPETTSRAEPAPTLRTHFLALLTPLVLTHALQSAGGLLDGFWLGRLLGVAGIATAASFFPVFWACPAAFLAMLVLYGLTYRHKEKEDGLFRQPGVALGAAGGRAPGA
jgi:Na+-driven multidrug efflux pump